MDWTRVTVVAIGLAIVAVWSPLLVTGVASLRSRGRFGASDVLIVTGPYAHVRHPLYAGLSMTVVGLGAVVGSWALVAGGAVWLMVTYLWSLREEAGLADRFGEAYAAYRRATPRMVPRIGPLVRWLLIPHDGPATGGHGRA